MLWVNCNPLMLLACSYTSDGSVKGCQFEINVEYCADDDSLIGNWSGSPV